MKLLLLIIPVLLLCSTLEAQRVPSSYSNIKYDREGKLYFTRGDQRVYADTTPPLYTIKHMLGKATGTVNGIALDFQKEHFSGIVYYGFIPYGEPKHPMPIYRGAARIRNGKTELNIRQTLGGVLDMVDWRTKKLGTLGYRITDSTGRFLFDGVVSFKGNSPFEVIPSIYQGPFVNNQTPNSIVISFDSDIPAVFTIEVNNKTYTTENKCTHEVLISDLQPGTKYAYTIRSEANTQTYSFETAPAPGSRKPFVFAYTSDSRKSPGGGERDVYGTNAYMMKKIAAVAVQHDAKFMQFTGDMADGYITHKEDGQLQLANWKKAIEPFWHYMPVNVGMGNHEATGYEFNIPGGGWIFIDKFPYDTESAEASFAEMFVNPTNGPDSEDGNKYDTDKKNQDFPSYKENVYYYTYDNVAMIVLNSDYWYAPSVSRDSSTSGGLHGYIMDNQLKWLEETILKLEADNSIDHVFITQHTPTFPNGGHVGDDMWYRGNNNKRPFIAGKPVDKGIIERRDEYLDILINKSTKVIAILTGDEHNYNRLMLTSEVKIHPDNYPHKKVNVSRPIYQINNGAAGAPYYAQEMAPWSPHTKAFSVQNAICLFYVEGKKIKMKVVNPDALNLIDEWELR